MCINLTLMGNVKCSTNTFFTVYFNQRRRWYRLTCICNVGHDIENILPFFLFAFQKYFSLNNISIISKFICFFFSIIHIGDVLINLLNVLRTILFFIRKTKKIFCSRYIQLQWIYENVIDLIKLKRRK